MFRFGQPTKREYRGQRSVDSLSNFIEDQLLDPISKVSNMDELESLDVRWCLIAWYYVVVSIILAFDLYALAYANSL